MLVGVNIPALREEYASALPWPHLVVDDVVSRDTVYCGDWAAGAGGELELWSADMSKLGRCIEPRPGRSVMFETTSAHRHGIRAVSPQAHSRVVLASRFYSVEPPSDPPSPPLLTWSPRPGERRRDVMPTVAEVVRELRVRARRRRP